MARNFYPDYSGGPLDREVAHFLEEITREDSPPLASLTPDEVRRACDIRPWARSRDEVRRVEDLSIAGPGGPLPLRIYVPDDAGPLPVVVYFHGGGWVFGSLDEADHICRAFARRTQSIVVSVGYRLSPEHKHPAAVDDACAAVAWVEKNIAAHGGDPRAIAVAGESAGANLATVVCRIARDEKGPRIAYQLLLCPPVNLSSLDTLSYAAFGEGPWLPKKNIEYYYAQYLQCAEQAADPRVSPLLAENLRGLPPAHVITAEFDVLRDEGESYARRLRDEGVPVTYECYRGMIHSFFVLNAKFSRAEEAIDDCVAMLRERFAEMAGARR